MEHPCPPPSPSWVGLCLKPSDFLFSYVGRHYDTYHVLGAFWKLPLISPSTGDTYEMKDTTLKKGLRKAK